MKTKKSNLNQEVKTEKTKAIEAKVEKATSGTTPVDKKKKLKKSTDKVVEKEAKVKTTKTTGTIKPIKEKVAKAIKEEVKTNLVEAVVSKREVKYIYPEDCTDTLSRKKYRQQVRNKLHQLELAMRRIEDKQSKEFKAKQKEYQEYKKGKVKEGAAA